MSQFEYKQFYRRNRPHVHSPGAVLFITFRLAGSVPKSELNKYSAERDWFDSQFRRLASDDGPPEMVEAHKQRLTDFHRSWFLRFEEITDSALNGPTWLGEPEVRDVLVWKLRAGDGNEYRLDAFSIMSNHAHVVLMPLLTEAELVETRRDGRTGFSTEKSTLSKIMQSIKGSSAREANSLLGRSGAFWEHESFDHSVRGEEGFNKAVKYTLNNPVKAGLVSHWRDWPGNYLSPRLEGRFD